MKLTAEEKPGIVLAVLAGEIGLAEAARRHGDERELGGQLAQPVPGWPSPGVGGQPPGPGGAAGSDDERRMRAEIEQLKLALVEATVQLRIFRKGAELVEHVPLKTSR